MLKSEKETRHLEDKAHKYTLTYIFLLFQELISYATNRGHHPEMGPLGGEFDVAQCLPEVWEREKKWEI